MAIRPRADDLLRVNNFEIPGILPTVFANKITIISFD